MTSIPGTTMGVSAGNGMIHAALGTVDDHGRLSVDSRVIDVDPTDRLDRAGRVNSGIDLMLERARRTGSSVATIGVACRTARQGREIVSRGVGPRRQIHLVGDAESVAHALAESGEIAQHPEVVVVDCGDTGVTMFRLHASPGSGERISDIVRTTALSGFALDAALAEIIAADTPATATRAATAALISGCRTAKEDLTHDDSTTFQVAGVTRVMSATVLAAAIAPMASAAAAEVAAYLAAGPSGPTPVVVVGGLANIDALHDILVGACGVAVIRPASPELLCAVGAALLARSGITSMSRLAFIGGRRYRDLLSAVPLAVAGSLLAGAMLTVYAVGTALTGSSTPEYRPTAPVTSVEVTSAAGAPVDTTTAVGTQPPTGPGPTTTGVPVSTSRTVGEQVSPPANGPSWATTELPTTVPRTAVPTVTVIPRAGSTSPTPSTPDPTTTEVSPEPTTGTPPTTSPTTNVPFESPVPSATDPQTPIVTTTPVG